MKNKNKQTSVGLFPKYYKFLGIFVSHIIKTTFFFLSELNKVFDLSRL